MALREALNPILDDELSSAVDGLEAAGRRGDRVRANEEAQRIADGLVAGPAAVLSQVTERLLDACLSGESVPYPLLLRVLAPAILTRHREGDLRATRALYGLHGRLSSSREVRSSMRPEELDPLAVLAGLVSSTDDEAELASDFVGRVVRAVEDALHELPGFVLAGPLPGELRRFLELAKQLLRRADPDSAEVVRSLETLDLAGRYLDAWSEHEAGGRSSEFAAFLAARGLPLVPPRWGDPPSAAAWRKPV